MKQRRSFCFAAAALCILASCEYDHPPMDVETGAMAVKVSGAALSAADIARVTVTVSGDGISPDITAEMVESPDNHWSGLIDDIPAGEGRRFVAEAFDEEDNIVYSGVLEDVVIESGVTAQVTIFLQQTEPPEPFDNAVPLITSFTASPMTPYVGDPVSLTVVAVDPDGDVSLTYSWHADGGEFSDTTSPTTVWTAPETAGIYTLTVSVADSSGAEAELQATIGVLEHGLTGSAAIETTINSAPEILGIVPTPTRIDVGESTLLNLTAVDPDGDEMSFYWYSTCSGSFNNNRTEDPTFTLYSLSGDTCELIVDVSDGSYVFNNARLTIETGPPVVVETPDESETGAEIQ